MIVLTPEFPLYEEYGICFQCTAAADYDPVRNTMEFHELLILSATYTARTGKAIPIMLDAQDKIDAAERLAVSRRHRIFDKLRAAVDAEHPLNHLGSYGDDPRWSDEVNKQVYRGHQARRDAFIMLKHGGQP